MKKTRTKKLVLGRETVKTMGAGTLERVQGAAPDVDLPTTSVLTSTDSVNPCCA
ncbi:MAG TPA: hypothetical protein VFT22_44585 [Kofleriaceae bacterium]|nr:hypothetical protein [Kofleriaceae bacterium]